MFCTLKGAKPAGTFGSIKDPANNVAGLNVASNTSTVPPLKFAAYNRFLPPTFPIASPLYTADVLVTSTTACAPAAPFQAEIPPSSVVKINEAGVPEAS